MRDGHREHIHSTKAERMKDRASHGSGRSSRRDYDDDRHIREKDGRRIKHGTDTELDRVQKEIVEKEQATEDIMRNLNKQFTIFANNILPPEKK